MDYGGVTGRQEQDPKIEGIKRIEGLTQTQSRNKNLRTGFESILYGYTKPLGFADLK